MLAGARGEPRRGEVREIGDRAEAIAAAVAAARPGDAVVVAGKGHETGQKIGDVTLPFDDAEELAAAIAARHHHWRDDHWREAERGNPEPGPGARMIEMSLAEVAAVTGGRLHRATGTERVTGVEFDSRKVGPGGLFLALPGERVDGHDFAAAAVAAGAVAVLAAREVDAPAVLVPPADAGSLATGSYLAATDPDGSGAAVLAALARLAAHNVAVLSGPAGPASPSSGSPAAPARPRRRTCWPRSWPRSARPSPRPGRSTTSWACPGRHCVPTPAPATWCWSSPPAGAATSPRCAASRSRGSGWCSTSDVRTSASSARRRRSPRRRASWWRRCPPTGWPCSTPTTRPSPRWRRGPGPAS